jgi:hypothetical protein
MADQVFDPHTCHTTLAAVITQVLDNWHALPADIRQALDERRHRLTGELYGLQDHQRAMRIVEWLKTLEALPAVTAVAGRTLAAGKTPPMRGGFVRISESQVQTLQAALERAPKDPASASTRSEVTLFVKLDFPVGVEAGVMTPLAVQLVRTEPPAAQSAGSVIVVLEQLGTMTPVEVALVAPGFSEATGDWTRTVTVNGFTDSLPALFLLTAPTVTGRARITVRFQQALGSLVREVEVTPAAKGLESTRGFKYVGAATTTGQTVDFFTAVDFPAQVRPQQAKPLIVRLTLQQPAQSAAQEQFRFTFVDPRRPEWLEVVLHAPGFTDSTALYRRALALYPHSDSQPAVFWLKAGAGEGSQVLKLDFYHQDRLVSHVAFPVEVTPVLTQAMRVTVEPSPVEPLPAQPVAAPDLELRVVLDEQSNTLHFSLHSHHAELGYQRRDLGVTKLNRDEPRRFLERIFATLNAQASESGRDITPVNPAPKRAAGDELMTIGQTLFVDLFPAALQSEYWRLKELREAGTVRSLLITSDEPWIPWELVKPYAYDEEAGGAQHDGYLAETFLLSRWLVTKRSPPASVTITSARLVAPRLNLPSVAREGHFFARLETERQIPVGAPLRRLADVLHATRTGPLQLLHIAAHGDFSAPTPDESPIQLEGNEVLRPGDLVGSNGEAVRRAVVFLNACHTAQLDFALTGLGGWATRLVRDLGVSAFIGTLWRVQDELAAEFAIHFYERLRDGQTLGEALHAARLHLKGLAPANPTWLAYTLYGDPAGMVTWGK